LRTKAARTPERLWQAITEAFAAITSQDAQGWCTHAGDRVQSNGKALSPTHSMQGLACLDTAVGYWYVDVTGDLRTHRVCKNLREECVMSEPQKQAAVPLHWHLFRHDEQSGKQYMLPIYTKENDAMEAVAALKVNTHQTYEVEACQDPTCQS
jgi:hypothetical protein